MQINTKLAQFTAKCLRRIHGRNWYPEDHKPTNPKLNQQYLQVAAQSWVAKRQITHDIRQTTSSWKINNHETAQAHQLGPKWITRGGALRNIYQQANKYTETTIPLEIPTRSISRKIPHAIKKLFIHQQGEQNKQTLPPTRPTTNREDISKNSPE